MIYMKTLCHIACAGRENLSCISNEEDLVEIICKGCYRMWVEACYAVEIIGGGCKKVG